MDLFAGMPVRDLEKAREWYSRVIGAEPSFYPDDTEAVWTLEERRHVYVVVDEDHAGGGRLTLFVSNLRERVAAIGERGIEPTTDETYGNGVRKVEYLDPDGNQFGIGGGPE